MGVSSDDIRAAAHRLQGQIRTTPIMTVAGSELGVGGDVVMKLEYHQHSGTFKGRGATNFMLAAEIGDAGVVAASGGNHGVAVAWAAGRLGHRATIFIPTITAPAKVDRLQQYGADVHQVGAVYAEALVASDTFRSETGAVAVHAYDDPLVMAGAATTGLELAGQVSGLDTVLVACGGGGLSGGMAAFFGTNVRIVACETDGTPSFAEARKAGHPVDVEVGGAAADALGATRIGDLPWEALSAADAASAVTTDEAALRAKSILWDRFRIVVEPSTAVALAALLDGAYRPEKGERLAIVLCGANTTIG